MHLERGRRTRSSTVRLAMETPMCSSTLKIFWLERELEVQYLSKKKKKKKKKESSKFTAQRYPPDYSDKISLGSWFCDFKMREI
jgi:hypothetical protein